MGISTDHDDAATTTLLTARMCLELCRPGDRTEFIRLERDPEVMRFLNGGRAVDHSQAAFEAPFLMPRGEEPYVWTARSIVGKEFIGWFSLRPDGPRVAELGYRLARSTWGCGLASEGALALVNWAFEGETYDLIVASTMAINTASRRVLDKVGLRHIRTIQISAIATSDSNEHDEVEYELKRSQWEVR